MQRPVQKAYILVSSDPNEIQKMSAYAAQTLSSIIKTCLGPRAMQKMVLTKINSIELTNDGNSILREMDVSHPAARCLIELSQTQDNECGDGTTSVVILAAELLSKTVRLLDQYHPIRLCKALSKAQAICLSKLASIAVVAEESRLLQIVESSIATKLCTVLKVPIASLAIQAASYVKTQGRPGTGPSLDIKTDIRVEKILGQFEECHVLDGILLEKEIVHAQMRRDIANPRIILLDCPLEYKKGESVTSMEFSRTEDFARSLQIEEEQIRRICSSIAALKPDLLFTEKGISDLALSILHENNITAVRRIKKTESIRLSRATGATVMNRIEDLEPKHLGTAGKFEYLKINKDHYCRISQCPAPRAVTVVLRGPSNDMLAELERNFMDAIKVVKNLLTSPLLVPGGGSSEMNCAVALRAAAGDSLEQAVYAACSDALAIIPSIISSNSGSGNPLEMLHRLEQSLSASPLSGVDGITGEIRDMGPLVMEPMAVKAQCLKSSFGAVMQLLRVDGIIETKTK